jgi:hypothetical protein
MTQPVGTLTIPEIVIQGAAPSTILFSRASRITVGTRQISNFGQQIGLDVWFSVRRSLKPNEPNTCDLKIWNLSDSTRKVLEQSSQIIPSISSAPGAPNTGIPVKIEAGYVGNIYTIFLGYMRSGQTVRDGDDFVTEFQTGDGDEAQAIARINQQLGPTNAYTVAQALLAAMPSVGQGNLSAVADILKGSTLYQQGVLLKGNPKEMLTDLCASVGLEFTIQGQQALFLSLGQPLSGSAYKISSNTGLVGEPSVDTKGILSCVVLMLPGLRPGQPIVMDSEFVQGTFRITSMTTVGETAGNEWCHRLECKRYGLAA